MELWRLRRRRCYDLLGVGHDAADPCAHGDIFSEPDQHSVWKGFYYDLVLNQFNFMYRCRGLDGRESA
jgi:hypothetical protein